MAYAIGINHRQLNTLNILVIEPARRKGSKIMMATTKELYKYATLSLILHTKQDDGGGL